MTFHTTRNYLPIFRISLCVLVCVIIIQQCEIAGAELIFNEGIKEKKTVKEVSAREAIYHVVMEGTLDGFNTLLPPSGQRIDLPLFEPNIELSIENIGTTPLVNPRVKVNGGAMWLSMDDLLSDIIEEGMSDSEKARALYEFHIRHRAHAGEGIPHYYYNSPLLFYQGFNASICFNDDHILGTLWRSSDLKARKVRVYKHCISEVFFDDSWHLMDGDQNVFYLDYDNRTMVSVAELMQDHYLAKRTHHLSLMIHDARSPNRPPRRFDERAASLFIGETSSTYSPLTESDIPDISFTLRPDEKLVFLWKNRNKFRFYPAHRWYNKRLYHGKIEYNPTRLALFTRFGLHESENISTNNEEGYIRVYKPGQPAVMIIPFLSPYPIVGGEIELDISDQDKKEAISVALGKSRRSRWYPLDSHVVNEMNGPIKAQLDSLLAKVLSDSENSFYVKIQINEGAEDLQINHLKINVDFQTSSLSMPSLRLGDNKIRYSCNSPGEARITHIWRETTVNKPPDPAPKPLYPPDKGHVDTLRFTFKWESARDPDGDEIVDYLFMLSDRADCRWSLSPNFEKLISRTKHAGKAEYSIPYEGLLNPGQKYYWRVKSLDENGIWSSWSDIWSFIPEGPGRPEQIGYEIEGNEIILHWESSSSENVTAAHYYEIYGSNEDGFSPDPEPHEVLGLWPLPEEENILSREELHEKDVHGQLVSIPRNLVTTTDQTKIKVVGADLVCDDGFNKCFYRIQAVDENGSKSGYSRQLELPHPFIYSTPPQTLRLHKPFNFRVSSLYSLGRVLGGKPEYTLSLRERDNLSFSILNAPTGIKISSKTGIISGKISEMPHDGTIEFTLMAKSGTTTARQEVKLKVLR